MLLNVLPLHRTHIFRLSGLRHEGGAVVCSQPIGHMIIVDPPTWTCDINANRLWYRLFKVNWKLFIFFLKTWVT